MANLILRQQGTTAGYNTTDGWVALQVDDSGNLNTAINSGSVVKTITIANTATTYAAADCVGTLTEITNVPTNSNGVALLESITIRDSDNVKATLDFLIFVSTPTGTFTNDSAPTITAAEFAKAKAKIRIPNPDSAQSYLTVNSKAIYCLPNAGILIQPTTTSLFVLVLATAAHVFSNASALAIDFGFIQD